jgi:bifunctional ADP-heptose synthase (sugar kinase/adenylyltransferase)
VSSVDERPTDDSDPGESSQPRLDGPPSRAGARPRSPGLSGHSELVRLIQRFAGLRILTWADLVVDEFVITGEPRVSREAPVLILKYKHRRLLPGGGANAAANVAALGGMPLVLGEVGDDPAGERMVGLLRESGCDTSGVIVRKNGRTPRKTRFLAGDKHVALQQVVRVDRIEPFTRDEASTAAALDSARRLGADAAGVLISDYGLGFVEPALMAPVLAGLPSRDRMKVVLDSRLRLFDFEVIYLEFE